MSAPPLAKSFGGAGQKAMAAARAARQGALDETQQMLRTAASQITATDRAPAVPRVERGVGQSNPNIPNPNQYDDLAAYREKVAAETNRRMLELKNLIDQEVTAAKIKREQKEQAIAQAQAQQMQKEDQEKKEEKKGFMAVVSKAAKRIKGRLGQVGKGKMEKGRAASG